MTTEPELREHAASLTARLAERAEAESLLDVAWRSVDSPVGRLLVARTPRGVVRVAFEREGFDAVLDELAHALSPRILRAPSRLDEVARALDSYFAGRGERIDVPVDLSLTRGFRREVVEQLAAIPYGHTQSYGQVAAALGRPRAVRAAGTACATNPVPLVRPCHRVVRSDGTPGAYRGGEAAKRTLLDLEAAGH